MKALLLIGVLLLTSFSLSFGQDDKNFYKKAYQFYKPSGLLTQCALNGTDVTDAVKQYFLVGDQFKIVNTIGTDYVIQFLPWKNGEKTKKLVDKSDDNNNPAPIYFKLSIADFNAKCEDAFKRNAFTIGALTLPIKMRFGAKSQDGSYYKRDFNFSGDIALGFSIGWKHRYTNKSAFNMLTGLAISSINVSPQTTHDFISSETNQSALTWHFGLLYEVDDFQIGGFLGIDHLTGETGRHWMYRDAPWVGIGIGYSFLKGKKTSGGQD